MLISDLKDAHRLVADTHIWVWASGEAGGQERIRSDALPIIESAAVRRLLYASAVSVWEIALKAERGQALIAGHLPEWVRDQMQHPGVRVLPIDSRLSIASTALPRWIRRRDGREHRDPADRFIVATARRLNAVLVTCDEEVLDYAERGHVNAFDAR